MNNSISFEAVVKKAEAKTKKDKDQYTGDTIEVPITVITLEVQGYEPRAGTFVGKDEASITFEN